MTSRSLASGRRDSGRLRKHGGAGGPPPRGAAALAIAFFLGGCLASERRAEEAALERVQRTAGPGYGAAEPVEAVLRGRADDPHFMAQLAAGPTLELVQEAAVRRNPDLRATLERWAAFVERVPQRTALPYPTFRFGYSSMFLMNTFEGMQEIPFPTKLQAEGRTALAEARAAGADFRERRNLLRQEAAMAYAALYLARREVEIVDENLALLERLVQAARAKYTAGAATQSDVLRAEVERETLRSERAALARAVEIAASALNVLLDRAPEEAIGPLAPLPVPEAPPAMGGLFERALERRPELARAAHLAAAADSALSRARQEWIPDFAVGGAYVRDFGEDANEVEVSAGITLPIWWGAIRARIAEAEAEARRARSEARSARNRVLDQVKSASAGLAAAAERHAILAAEAVPRAEQNVKVSEAAYAAGQVDFLALIDAQRMLVMRQLERERARAEHAARRAELERALGGESEE